MNQKGMGLIEILAAITLGLIVFTGIAITLYYLILSSASTKAETSASQHLAAAMERITNTPLSSLNSQYPNGQSIASYSTAEFNTIVQNNPVDSETITVTYPGGTSANPREIVVTDTWRDRNRLRTISMRTFRRG